MVIKWLLLLSIVVRGFQNVRTLKRSSTVADMFSGIVEDMGIVDKLEVKDMSLWDGSVGKGTELTITSPTAMQDAYIGCSIAVNGVCLTATSIDLPNAKFSVGLAPETLRRTNLGLLRQGSKVNIERALRADSRNSGHFVQGHVDCVGNVINKWKENDSLWLKIEMPAEYMVYIVPKGFVAIDGTSLTICDVDYVQRWFTIMLISHTQASVILPFKEVGDGVNIEVDVLAKMVEQSVRGLNERVLALEKTISSLQRP